MKFTRNDAGIEHVIKGSGVRAELRRVADVAADDVRGQGQRIRFTGAFGESIEITDIVPVPEGIGLAVHSTDHAAHLIEFGSANNPAFAPFRKTATSLGLKLGPGRRI